MNNRLCIYHGGCDDGFGAALVMDYFYHDGIELYPGVYQKDPPDVTGKEVYLVDFSYKRAVLLEMLEKCSSMTILDHHKTAQEDLIGLEHPKLAVVFDMERSGAGITWDYFFGRGSRPAFINYIEDRDLWKRELPNSDEFTIALRSYPQDFKVWYEFMKAENLGNLIGEGHAIQRYYRQRVEEFKKQAYTAMLAGVSGLVCNANYFAASEVAGELAEQSGTFGACFYERADGSISYSLRSRGKFDVSEIALVFGGGGHKNAAGFASSTCVHTRIK